MYYKVSDKQQLKKTVAQLHPLSLEENHHLATRCCYVVFVFGVQCVIMILIQKQSNIKKIPMFIIIRVMTDNGMVNSNHT